MLASLLNRRLTRCFANAAIVLAMVALPSSALAAPRTKTETAKPTPSKVVAKQKTPSARHPWKKAKSAPPKPKPGRPKTKPTPKAGPHPSAAPRADTHSAPLAA